MKTDLDDDVNNEPDADAESVSLLPAASSPVRSDRLRRSLRRWKQGTVILLLLCAALLACCSFLLVRDQYCGSLSRPSRTYFGSPQKILTPFSHDWRNIADMERQGGANYRYKDEEWEHLFPDNGGSVALTKDLARSYGLPNASETKEDPSKMIYFIAGYHQLHCLWYLREYFYYANDSFSNFDTLDMTNHIPHCFEALRMALTCFLDPTLIPLGGWPGIPNGYEHECRNRDAMYRWAQEHGHDIPSS